MSLARLPRSVQTTIKIGVPWHDMYICTPLQGHRVVPMRCNEAAVEDAADAVSAAVLHFELDQLPRTGTLPELEHDGPDHIAYCFPMLS